MHIDSTDYGDDAIIDAKKHGAKIVQLFVNTRKNMNEYEKIKKALKENNIECVIHASYTINLGQNWDEYSFGVQELINEIEYAGYLDAKAIIVHMGKYMDLSREEAINNMYTSLIYVYKKTQKYANVKILLETPAGQKSELGYKLDELTKIYRKFSKHRDPNVSARFGICLDTCHVFSAGYNFNSIESINIYFDNFDEMIGINEINLIHLNDSKVASGTRVDRHANIGHGYIGKEFLLYIAKIFHNLNVPMILETSYPTIYNDMNIMSKLLL